MSRAAKADDPVSRQAMKPLERCRQTVASIELNGEADAGKHRNFADP
jgi:hypothetical protein